MKAGLFKGGHFDVDIFKTRALYHNNHWFYYRADASSIPDPTPDVTVTHKYDES